MVKPMANRRTRNQAQVLEVLTALEEEISAQDLYVKLRDRQYSMGLATVYRSLEALKLDGVIQVRTLPNGEAVYRPIQTDQHHLTCLQCGNSIPIDECPVHDLETELHHHHQFKIFYHTLEFFGLCTKCQEA